MQIRQVSLEELVKRRVYDGSEKCETVRFIYTCTTRSSICTSYRWPEHIAHLGGVCYLAFRDLNGYLLYLKRLTSLVIRIGLRLRFPDHACFLLRKIGKLMVIDVTNRSSE